MGRDCGRICFFSWCTTRSPGEGQLYSVDHQLFPPSLSLSPSLPLTFTALPQALDSERRRSREAAAHADMESAQLKERLLHLEGRLRDEQVVDVLQLIDLWRIMRIRALLSKH
jgi:hypothetical protein